MPPLHGLRVVRSNIHGYGVVALRPIRKGEVITYGDGVLYQEDDEFDDSYALVLHNPEGEDLPNVYYDLADKPLLVVPSSAEHRPNRDFLAFHRSSIFRP